MGQKAKRSSALISQDVKVMGERQAEGEEPLQPESAGKEGESLDYKTDEDAK